MGAYVLHALPPDEEIAFENHLARCRACRREVAALRTVVVELSSGPPPEPPGELRAQVLAKVATTRQEGPSGAPRPPGGKPSRPMRLALAACLAAAAAFGGIALWQHQEAVDVRARTQERVQEAEALADVLAAPDARISTAELSNGATGCVVLSRSESQAAFIASGLPKLESGKVYELWYDDSGTPRRAGTLTGKGNWHIQLLDGPVDQATAVGITVEPTGGSTQPTTDPIGVIDLPA
ncbi:anti-sigma factor domain-containing protein [Streptomyces sp. NPDC006879]|uniref:anti-sigma factor n=1 Tax=Streptomyces sp. NPDC006879 TaxID=3364767 RepID=UPI003693036D